LATIDKDLLGTREILSTKKMHSFRRFARFGGRAFATQSKPAKSNALAMTLVASIFALGPGYYWFQSKTAAQKRTPIDPVVAPTLIDKKEEKEVDPIPGVPYVQYVLVGGGTAAYSALEAIREKEPNAQVLLITEEEFVPYQRPPLSKELWLQPKNTKDLTFVDWQNKESSVFYLPANSFKRVSKDQLLKDLSTTSSKVMFLSNTRVEELDAEKQVLYFSKGAVQYGKVLIATGGTPRIPQFMKDLPKSLSQKMTTFRGINDFKALEKVVSSSKTIAVIGGGFLGSEIVAALAHKAKSSGSKVVQIFPEDGNLSLVLPNYLTKWTTAKLSEEGVIVKANSQVIKVEEQEGKVQLYLKGAEEPVVADHVVVAVGLKPNTDVAEHSDLEIDPIRDGIVVNAELEARSNVFAAGDVSSYHDIALGRRRVEHYDHAAMSGRTAGLNMTGAKKPYIHQSMFWSNIGPEIAFEAVGILDSNLPTVSIWSKAPGTESKDFNRGVVYYMKDQVVTGVLLWNLHGKVQTIDLD
jgi:programmed cell death 8 (apoptosis-inducing factor)